MSYVVAIVNIAKFLPEIISLVKVINGWVKQGITTQKIKTALKSIESAFVIPDRKQAAKELNEVFRNK